jgi:hypothetical protein
MLQGQQGLCPKMAALFVFDYLARLIIAPQPERANPAPGSVPLLLARGFFVWRLGGRFVWGAVVA